jgi:hypothetical protein
MRRYRIAVISGDETGDAVIPPGIEARRAVAWRSIAMRSAPRISGVLAVAFALAGCNANQTVNPSSQRGPGVVAGPDFPGYNPDNPISYGQTSGFYAGR